MSETATWSPTSVLSEPDTHARPEPQAHQPSHDALPAAWRLDEFEIIRVLGAGGFGIVYLALDHVLLRYVAIKEYMPGALAGRGPGASVLVRSPGHAETYAVGLESFFSEARMLASFDHPSLVKVHRFWKGNGTAYMAMQYYPGRTLREVRSAMQAAPDEAWLLDCLEPILGALEVLHGEGVYHRDIAPDNILLLPDGRPVLLDFGSARRVIGDRTQSLTAILKPNFAPIEQYADEPGMRQGPWTDLYALGATVHFMLTGKVPVPAVLRAVRDTLSAVSMPEPAAGQAPASAFLAAIDWTLALAPDERPQSVASLRRGLAGEVPVPPPGPRYRAVEAVQIEAAQATAAQTEEAAVDAALPEMGDRPAPAEVSKPQVRRNAAAWLAGAGVALFAVAALVWSANRTPVAAVPPVSATASGPALASVPTPAPAASSVAIAVAVPEPAPAGPPGSAPSFAPARHESAPPRALADAKSIKAPAHPASAPEIGPKRLASTAPPTAALPVAAPVKSPKELCGDLNFFSMALCVARQCQSPALQSHPQCVESRRFEEQRKQRMDQ